MSTKKQTTANKSSQQKCFFTHKAYALATAQTIIVLPAFVRSCSADEKK